MNPSTHYHTLEHRSDRFEKVDGHWYYKAHDGIRLFQIYITYAPEEKWPHYISGSGHVVRESYPYWPPPHLWMMWRQNASDEFLGALRRNLSVADANKSLGRTWNGKYGKGHMLQVWPEGEGMQVADLPLETQYPLADGLRVRLPKEAVEGAKAMGVISDRSLAKGIFSRLQLSPKIQTSVLSQLRRADPFIPAGMLARFAKGPGWLTPFYGPGHFTRLCVGAGIAALVTAALLAKERFTR